MGYMASAVGSFSAAPVSSVFWKKNQGTGLLGIGGGIFRKNGGIGVQGDGGSQLAAATPAPI
jgi:hypothetical protein